MSRPRFDRRDVALIVSFVVIAILSGLLWIDRDRPAVDAARPVASVATTSTAPPATTVAPAVPLADGPEARPGSPVRVLVVGDSVAAQTGWALHAWSEEHPGTIVVFNESHLGCGVVRYGEKRVDGDDQGPVGDVCSNWNEPVALQEVADVAVVSWPSAVALFQPDMIVATVSSWDVSDRIVPGVADEWTAIGDPAFDAYVLSEYTLANRVLADSGADVYWLMSPYLNREVLPPDHEQRVDGINEIVATAAASVRRTAREPASITLVDYPAWIGPVGGTRDTELRDDGVHLSDAGLDQIAPWLIGEMGLS